MCWEYTPVDASGKPTQSSYPEEKDEAKDTEPVAASQGAVSSRHRKKKKGGRAVGEKSPATSLDGAQNNMTNANPYVNSFARVHV